MKIISIIKNKGNTLFTFASFVLYMLVNLIRFGICDTHEAYADEVPLYQPDQMATTHVSERVDYDYKEKIFEQRENVTFVTKLLRDLTEEQGDTSQGYYFEHNARSKVLTKSGGDTAESPVAGQTRDWELSASELKGIVPRQTFRVMGVSAGDPATKTIDVVVVSKASTYVTVRPINTGKKIVAIPDATKVFQVSTFYPQGSSKSSPVNTKMTRKQYQTYISKNSFKLTNTLLKEKMRGPREFLVQMNTMEDDHAEDLESGVLLNPETILADEANGLEGMFQGLMPKTKENSPCNKFYGSTYEYKHMIDWTNNLSKIRRTQGGQYNHKIFLCNAAAIIKTWEMAMAKNFDIKDNNYFGIDGVKRIRFPKLTADLVEHPIISDQWDNDELPFIFALDVKFAGLVMFRDTKVEQGIQISGDDGKHVQIMTEMAAWSARDEKHGLFASEY